MYAIATKSRQLNNDNGARVEHKSLAHPMIIIRIYRYQMLLCAGSTSVNTVWFNCLSDTFFC